MVLNPPDIFPLWAENDQVDPTSKQNNVETPPAEKQLYGWDFKDYPVRNWANWLGRYTSKWIKYLAQNDPKSRTVVTFASASGSDSDGPIVTVPLTALRPIVMIYINDTASGNNSSRYIGMYTVNNSSSVVPNTIASSHITVGAVNKDTGILQAITSDASTPGPFNIIAVQFDSFN